MFICNVKINGSKVFKYFFISIVILIICILCFVTFKIFTGASNSANENSHITSGSVCKISSNNYTNVLKAVHENIDDYVGVKINFTGYVYRVFDLKDNQFILSRDMIISSDFQSVVVGFLCEYDDSKTLDNDSWIELTGEIFKGDYHGDMPIIKVTNIKNVDKPNEEYVYPPDESYIPTSGIL